MPELPEVETVRRGLEPQICGRRIVGVICRVPRLRLPLDPQLEMLLGGQVIHAISRRAKYLLFKLDKGTLLLHLGMSGVLRLVKSEAPIAKHDHVDLRLDDGQLLRFNDTRRFGLLLYLQGDPNLHSLLQHLGPEPLETDLPEDYLFTRSRKRNLAIKNFIMDQKVLVGVGNIYASEALFAAGIDPRRKAGRIKRQESITLLRCIQAILAEAIIAGGTTLKDFRQSDGRPGYFKQQLQVYGRKGMGCLQCDGTIQQVTLGQRSTYFCENCQG
ncbi:bifunctional DNA-formamidopyrimidine glycosylase/DNA-(apurinic or apyrimidinic site) lyase [Geopsychrobacter electrodiphilus]|uniref:bifunctional DNA-formamidopyrimidine glycosylase/DNA-(apurinic or apyrimidinic site) lyase n=1 Tax=Geopsychrobacter electrodiphilus TaxID=225196 RepID=UPI00036976F9|nr:bifunctional DNA-formamidopyrimidine glycosylase/DNA-(apurinic or apyrimidinic site) lyase [Geopsychrobacter electrodiphilus]